MDARHTEADSLMVLRPGLRRALWRIVGERLRQKTRWGAEHEGSPDTGIRDQLARDYAAWALVTECDGDLDQAQGFIVRAAALVAADVERLTRAQDAPFVSQASIQ